MVGKKIAQLRKNRGWTQDDLARAVNLSRGYITAIEGDNVKPRLKTLALIAVALGVDVKELFKKQKED